ncbi:hypothetical protein [Litoreibacter janthinus]|uniref:Uncharacterized protein n=1 Tax=Litoreibacter janthinus TaxID=670154 RepID=A0A1I6G8C7_9RHOB|nr:hypothetical protein [Litoreibacter janthinus]SFR38456.1 hypothetical protein SAMN04488002_1053 [Litoreibacter janthinus]
MLRTIALTLTLLSGLPLAAETVTILSTRSWVEPDEGRPFFRLTTPDWTSELRETEDENTGLIVLAPADGRWRHESTFELEAGKLPYLSSVEEVIHCDETTVVLSTELIFGGPTSAIMYERYRFDFETGELLGHAFDELSRDVGGLLPAASVVAVMFPDC